MNFYQAFELNKTKQVVGPNSVIWPVGMMHGATPDFYWRHDHVFGEWRKHEEPKERPILFSSEMVQAILKGKKTQTRRIIKNDLAEFEEPSFQIDYGHSGFGAYIHESEYPEEGSVFLNCPFGRPGDRLWVRETFSTDALSLYPCPKAWYKADEQIQAPAWTHTCPDESKGNYADCLACWEEQNGPFKWKPSIFMPRSLSRIDLEITGIKVERLQDGGDRAFWGEEKWILNPYVWVVEFKRI